MQSSNSGRVVSLVVVSQGNVYYANAGATSWSTPTNNTADAPPLNYTGILFSAQNGQNLYFADGTNWVYFNPVDSTVNRWEPLDPVDGPLPVDEEGNKPRLIETWRGRLLLAGLLLDPSNIHMSRVNDPTDYVYFPDTDAQGPDQAIALSVAPQGKMGDLVTSLCPYSDDLLIVFCDSSIYAISGDPMMGGQIDLVTKAIGGTWGRCWAMDPYGNVYFMSNKMGVYVFKPGAQPQRISQPIEQLLQDVDTGDNGICLGWDDKLQALHIFITPLGAPAPSTHFMFEQRTQAWFTTVFGNDLHSPLVCCTFDGNEPGDRTLLISSWDGYVRKFDKDAEDDDGTEIESEVLIGPFVTKSLDEIKMHEAQAVLGEESGNVTYGVQIGKTAEQAVSADPIRTGTWKAGRNLTTLVSRAAHALYIRISSVNKWSIEQVRLVLEPLGKIRARGR